VAVAVGIGSAPGYARLVRGQALLVRGSAYVEAALALGHSRARVLWQHVAPNAIRPLIPVTGLGVGKAIVWSSSLSFLGLGVKPPSSEWGALLAAGKAQLLEAPALMVVPGTAVVLLALSFSTLFSHIQARAEIVHDPAPFRFLLEVEDLSVGFTPPRACARLSAASSCACAVARRSPSWASPVRARPWPRGLCWAWPATRPWCRPAGWTSRAAPCWGPARPGCGRCAVPRWAMCCRTPWSPLDPLRPIRHEIAEALHAHGRLDAAQTTRRTLTLLRDVGVPEPEQRQHQYPSELSGGLRQRRRSPAHWPRTRR
jgi:hypothetical protein